MLSRPGPHHRLCRAVLGGAYTRVLLDAYARDTRQRGASEGAGRLRRGSQAPADRHERGRVRVCQPAAPVHEYEAAVTASLLPDDVHGDLRGQLGIVQLLQHVERGGVHTLLGRPARHIIDLVGWDGANFFDSSPGPTTSNTTALVRAGGGCTDTDNNAADFTTGAPDPRNSVSLAAPCSTQAVPAPGTLALLGLGAFTAVQFPRILARGNEDTDFQTDTFSGQR
jgi:hypothetical protein